MISEAKAQAKATTTVNVLVVGHVDAGKSTLFGHMALLCGGATSRDLQKASKAATALHKESFAYAFLLDSGQEERERGVTIDVCNHVLTFSLPQLGLPEPKQVILQDCPGHADYVPNLISSVALPDAAVLVVDSSPGEFEKGVAPTGQTLEHLYLLMVFGVRRLIIAVNKMDRHNWGQDRFMYIREELGKIIRREVGFDGEVEYLPVSGLLRSEEGEGEGNLFPPPLPDGQSPPQSVVPGPLNPLCPWYSPCVTLAESLYNIRPLDHAKHVGRNRASPVVLLYDIYPDSSGNHSGFGCTALVVQGVLSVEDSVAHLPTRMAFTIQGMDVLGRTGAGTANKDSSEPEDAPVTTTYSNAHAGEHLTLYLQPDKRTIRGCVACSTMDPATLVSQVRPGSVLVLTGAVLEHEMAEDGQGASQNGTGVIVSDRIKARVMVIDGELGLGVGETLDCYVGAGRLNGRVHKVDGILDPRSGKTIRKNPPLVGYRQHARVDIIFESLIALSEFSTNRLLGRLVLRRGGKTIALGFVEKIAKKEHQ